jgi:hypothetical protein
MGRTETLKALKVRGNALRCNVGYLAEAVNISANINY